MANVALRYVGKLDRRRREQVEEAQYYSINPQTDLEHLIEGIRADVSGPRYIEPIPAVQLYTQLRNHRHDLWIQYLEQTKASETFSFGDVRAGDYLMRLPLDNNPFIGMEAECPSMFNKTPDILTFVPNGAFFFVGDVTVTSNYTTARGEKTLKYRPLVTYIQQKGFRVIVTNLIVMDTLDSLEAELAHLSSSGLTEVNDAICARTAAYHNRVCRLMKLCRAKCSNKRLFSEELALRDSLKDIEQLVVPDLEYDGPLEPVKPTRTNEEIIQMVKDEVDRIDISTYFDSTMDDTEQAFDKLIDNYRTAKHKAARSTLQVVSNLHHLEPSTNYELIRSYIYGLQMAPEESTIKDYILGVMPTLSQLNHMETYQKTKITNKELSVFGPYQYYRKGPASNTMTLNLNYQLTKGKANPNTKKEPTTVDPSFYDDCTSFINQSISYYGSKSGKPSFLSDDWDTANNFERDQSTTEKAIYDYTRCTNGAQLANAMSNLYQRIIHLRTSYSNKDNIYVPPNGAYIAVIPKEHAPVSSKRCDLPFLFVTRFKKDELPCHIEYEYKVEGEDHYYYISKLCRLDVNKITCWDQAGYRLVATASYILSRCPVLIPSKEKVIGILTYLILDTHQKTSEYLDLFKYVAYMPFADITRLSTLVTDKMNLMTKTALDIWLLVTIRGFLRELSKKELLQAKKPKITIFNAELTRESLGMDISLPSFCAQGVRHNSVEDYIEEITLLNIVRPKHLYGSQFMDKSITSTCEWNVEYDEEKAKYGGWVQDGDSDTPFPFNAKFAYSRDAIVHAYSTWDSLYGVEKRRVDRKIASTAYNGYMHYNCSLRGCTKSKGTRKTSNDLHTTSIEACLTEYEKRNYEDKECTVLKFGTDYISSKAPMQFTMSEKDQRGGGRPISTPTLGAKAALMLIEKPEQAIGTYTPNNIIVEGKNKLKEQSDAYKKLVVDASVSGFKELYQLTEDQSKFSENDNTRKYEAYIRSNHLLPIGVRKIQLAALQMLTNREHLVHRLPKLVTLSKELSKCINKDQNGVTAQIGWPQGMLNFISTSVHSVADVWITESYNLAYPDDRVLTTGLVHSDDSWVTIACKSLDSFKRFTLFRMLAKRLFCLKLNEKKLWGSRYLGELVSNYNINGNVHLPISKSIANSFGNLMYQNWVIDVHNQVSSLQQCYRNGAKIPTLVLLKTILRQQLFDSYQVKGLQKELAYVLPVELGGFPNLSAFELAVGGVNSHYSMLMNNYKIRPHSDEAKIVGRCIALSEAANKEQKIDLNGFLEFGKKYIPSEDPIPFADDDYEVTTIAHRGDLFTCVRHIMPKSKKVNITLNKIRSLPFESEGLEMIITRPRELRVALGNLKSQTKTMLYALASEHYTQNARRLAISQVIQSSGKVVRLLDDQPMTFNELYVRLLSLDRIGSANFSMLEVAFSDDSHIPELCNQVVNYSSAVPIEKNSRKIINRMPNFDNKFVTIAKFKNVLLYIVSKLEKDTNQTLLNTYGDQVEPMDVLEQDAALILKRFNAYFTYYKPRYAVNLIMQQELFSAKSRLWMQPYLRSDTLENFVADLYGQTVANDVSYRMEVDYSITRQTSYDSKLVNSLYTIQVLNNLYPDSFQVQTYNDLSYEEALLSIDPANLHSNDEELKHAILWLLHNGNDTYCKQYDDNKVYDQIYLQAQKRVGGRYVGPFDVMIRYSGIVMRIVGEPENLRIKVNKPEVTTIMKAMQMFVEKNFQGYKYGNYAHWSTSKFWECNLPIQSKWYLTSYSGCQTIIKKDKTHNSLPIEIIPTLNMGPAYVKQLGESYEVHENLRVLYKFIRGKRVRVGAAVQNMSCPFSDSMSLVPTVINGLPNDNLLKNKLMINITSRKYYANSKSEYRAVLDSALHRPSIKTLVDFYASILRQLKNDLQYRFDEQWGDDPEIQEFIITGRDVHSVVAEASQAEPESLAYIQAEYGEVETQKPSAIAKHSNIKTLMYQVVGGMSGPSEIKEVIHLLLADETLIRELSKHVIPQDWVEDAFADIDELLEALAETDTEISQDVAAYIIGNKLNMPATLDTLDVRGMLGTRVSMLTSNRSLEIANKLAKAIKTDIFGLDEVDASERLVRYMARREV